MQSQKADIASAIAQLPELRDRLGRHDAAIGTILTTVKTIESRQEELLAPFDEMFNGLALSTREHLARVFIYTFPVWQAAEHDD